MTGWGDESCLVCHNVRNLSETFSWCGAECEMLVMRRIVQSTFLVNGSMLTPVHDVHSSDAGMAGGVWSMESTNSYDVIEMCLL